MPTSCIWFVHKVGLATNCRSDLYAKLPDKPRPSRASERERECVCVCERERESVCVSVRKRERERDHAPCNGANNA